MDEEGSVSYKQCACIQRTPDSKSTLLNPRLEGRTSPRGTIEGLDAAAKKEAL